MQQRHRWRPFAWLARERKIIRPRWPEPPKPWVTQMQPAVILPFRQRQQRSVFVFLSDDGPGGAA